MKHWQFFMNLWKVFFSYSLKIIFCGMSEGIQYFWRSHERLSKKKTWGNFWENFWNFDGIYVIMYGSMNDFMRESLENFLKSRPGSMESTWIHGRILKRVVRPWAFFSGWIVRKLLKDLIKDFTKKSLGEFLEK